ncbi:MAG: GntR family transcriptional regulator [Anaerolineales bacterium]|nr:GntR family transcriptional regulator [Anaerolineales bacterium]
MNVSNSRENSGRQPLYQRTADALMGILETMAPGAYLPSEPKLAKQLGVSRATLREAMRTFEARGWIVRKQGVGTYVTQPPQVIETGLELLESIESMAARIGMDVDMGELSIKERPANKEDARWLELREQNPLVEIARVIRTENRPVAYLIDILPMDILPVETLRKGFKGSVLDLLIRRGDPALGYSMTDITAVPASPTIARKMSIQRGDELLCLKACLYTRDRRPIDHSYSYFLPGTFRFHVVRRVEAV